MPNNNPDWPDVEPTRQELALAETTRLERVAQELQERKARIDSLMRGFATTRTLSQANKFIKCGLEFEFHSLDGQEGNGEGEVDVDALSDASSEAVCNASATDILEYGRNKEYNELILSLNKQGLSYNDLPSGRGSVASKLEDYYQECEQEWRSDWEDNNVSDYYTRGVTTDNISGWSGIRRFTELGDDPSVRGGEIRTLGPRTIGEFLKVSNVLAQNDFEVAVNTSFHIHLSIPGIEHAYGERFQAEMYAYLLSNHESMPKGLQERLVAPSGALQWAKFALNNENKYCAIFKHGQGTWEFRLFGNVSTRRDMTKCLQLAIGALRHAYAVKLGLTESLLGGHSLQMIETALENCRVLAPGDFLKVLNEMSMDTPQIESDAA